MQGSYMAGDLDDRQIGGYLHIITVCSPIQGNILQVVKGSGRANA
jgi:hypothetical protein